MFVWECFSQKNECSIAVLGFIAPPPGNSSGGMMIRKPITRMDSLGSRIRLGLRPLKTVAPVLAGFVALIIGFWVFFYGRNSSTIYPPFWVIVLLILAVLVLAVISASGISLLAILLFRAHGVIKRVVVLPGLDSGVLTSTTLISAQVSSMMISLTVLTFALLTPIPALLGVLPGGQAISSVLPPISLAQSVTTGPYQTLYFFLVVGIPSAIGTFTVHFGRRASSQRDSERSRKIVDSELILFYITLTILLATWIDGRAVTGMDLVDFLFALLFTIVTAPSTTLLLMLIERWVRTRHSR